MTDKLAHTRLVNVDFSVSLTERWVTSSTTEVDKSTLGEKDDVSARLHLKSVNLGLDLDVLDGVGLQPCDVNLDIEVTNAGNC